MLPRHHGASALGRFLLRRTGKTMSSSPASTYTTSAMRSILALMGRTPSAMVRPSPQSRSKIWNPSNIIIFGNSQEPAPTVGSIRASSTVSSAILDHDLGFNSDIDEPFVLQGAIDSPIEGEGLLHSIASSCETSGRDLIPPSTPQSAERTGLSYENDTFETNEILEQKDDTELHIDLSFKIPEEVLEKAKAAAAETPESFWSYKMYAGPKGEKIKVHYCKSKTSSESVLKYFTGEKVLGFDIEWKPEANRNSGIKKNVSLIQIASENRIALFHLACFPKDGVEDLVPPSLKKIMEDPEITKVGVAIKADCTRLRKYLEIDSKGIFELSHIYKLVKYSSSGDFKMINKRLVSLALQIKEHMGLPLFKGEVRGSDWSEALSMDQIFYAASDSYAGFMLYDVLESKRKQLKPTPPRPYHVEKDIPIRLASGIVIPCPDEAAEEPELEADSSKLSSQQQPASDVEAAAAGIEIEQDAEVVPENASTSTSKQKSRSKSKQMTSISRPQSYLDADKWATDYREAHPVPSTLSIYAYAGPAALRAYALWKDDPSLSILDVAGMLREPPLKESTVNTYIVEAIRTEKFQVDRKRLRGLLEGMAPLVSNQHRYKALWALVRVEKK